MMGMALLQVLFFCILTCFAMQFFSKPALSGHSKEDQKKVFKTDYHCGQKNCRMLQEDTFVKLPFVFKTFFLFLNGRLKQVLL